MAFTSEQLQIIETGFQPAFETKYLPLFGYQKVLLSLLFDLHVSLNSPINVDTIDKIGVYCTAILQELEANLKPLQVALEMNNQYALLLIDHIATLIPRGLIDLTVDIVSTGQLRIIIEKGIEALNPEYLTEEYIDVIITLLLAKIPKEKVEAFISENRSKYKGNKKIFDVAHALLGVYAVHEEKNRTDFPTIITDELVCFMTTLKACEYPDHDPDDTILVLQLTDTIGLRIKYDQALIVDLDTLPPQANSITIKEVNNILAPL